MEERARQGLPPNPRRRPPISDAILREIDRVAQECYDPNDAWCVIGSEAVSHLLTKHSIDHAHVGSNFMVGMGGVKIDDTHEYIVLLPSGWIIDPTIRQFIDAGRPSEEQKRIASGYPFRKAAPRVALIAPGDPFVEKMGYDSHLTGRPFKQYYPWMHVSRDEWMNEQRALRDAFKATGDLLPGEFDHLEANSGERFHIDFDFKGQALRLVSYKPGRDPKITSPDDADAPSWPRARAEQILATINKNLGPRLVPARPPAAKTRGRFYIIPEDGWTLVDDKWKGTVAFESKNQAEQWKSHAIAYVKRWGDINFYAFPTALDDKPVRMNLNDIAEDDPADAPTWDAIDDQIPNLKTLVRKPTWPRMSHLKG